MRSILYLAVSAFAALAAAADNPFNIPSHGYDFTAGSATTLSWKPTTSGTVTLKLQWGSVTPTSGEVIASGIPNSGHYTWTPSPDLPPRPDYTIEIIDDSDPNNYNFLPRFVISGLTGTATASTATATGTTASASATASTATTLSTVTKTAASTTSSVTSSVTSSSTSTKSESSTTSSSSASSTAAASTTTTAAATTTAAPSNTNVPDLNAGMSLKVPAGMMAIVMGAMMAM